MHCKAPFSSLSISPKGYNTCCQYPFLDKEYDFNSDNFKNIRKSILSQEDNFNIRCDQCTICRMFNKEDVIIDTYNNNMSKYNHNTGAIEEYELSHVHICFGNLCSSACKTCNDNNSITYGKLYNNTGFETKSYDYKDIIVKNKKYINEVTIIGGEVFLYRDDIEFLIDTLNDGVKLVFFTNGTIFDEDLMIRMSEKFNLVIGFSVDALGDRNNYIRPKCDYNIVKENILKTKEISKYAMCISITVSILNIMDIDKIIDGLTMDFGNDMNISINPVLYPYHYNINILPNYIKDQILEKILYINRTYPKTYTMDLLKTLCIDLNNDIPSHIKILKDDIIHKDKVFNFNTIDFINKSIYDYVFEGDK